MSDDTPEAIIRALVATGGAYDRDYNNCELCTMPSYVTDHEPTCPYQRACDWVEAHPIEAG